MQDKGRAPDHPAFDAADPGASPTQPAAPAVWPAWARWLTALLVLAILALSLLAWRLGPGKLTAAFTDLPRIAAAVRGAGGWGPLLIIGLQTAQVVLAPIPGQVVNLAAGYLFGVWWGTLYSWLGGMLGTIIALVIARFAGRPLVTRLVSPPALARLDRFAEGRGLLFFFLVFLLPFLPDDLACFVAGLTPLPLGALIAVAAVGRLPTIAATVWAGANAGRLPWYGWGIAGILVAIALYMLWRHGERIQEILLGFAARGRG
jgi:uncharacterized membrane protein YdjX (TVP38/TMEM64 family)